MPDIVTRPQPSAGLVPTSSDRDADGNTLQAGDALMSPRSDTDAPLEDLSDVSFEWIRVFMSDFKAVRLKIARQGL